MQNQADSVANDNDPITHKDSLETMSSQNTLSDAQNIAFIHALENSVTNNQTPTNMENLKHLTNLLYNVRYTENLLNNAEKNSEIINENNYPLDCICKVYLEITAGVLNADHKILENIEIHV